jgi:hypothetical protein
MATLSIHPEGVPMPLQGSEKNQPVAGGLQGPKVQDQG